MYSGDIALSKYPEWYKVEKDTEKTIKKLTTIKELSFYLRNSDEYIRRLAILRIAELKLKDSIDYLREVLDDRLEIPENKELAAWTIKAISHKWNVDLFISNKLLSKYNGTEKFLEINKVTINDTSTTLKFEFASSQINSELRLDDDDVRHSEEVNFDMPFSLKEWFEAWMQVFLAAAKNIFINLPSIMISFLKAAGSFVLKNLIIKPAKFTITHIPLIIEKIKNRPRREKKEETKDSYSGYSYYSYNPSKEKSNPLAILKKLVFNLFYVILSPIRFIVKHKKAGIAVIFAAYLFFTYTTIGKVITYKYWGIDLHETQNQTISTSKEILSYAWSEAQSIFSTVTENNASKNTLNTLPGTSDLNKSSNAAVMNNEDTKKYRVTAKTGLNLRKSPDTKAAKVSEQKLALNTTVTYLNDSQKDATGMLWYYIQTPDGKTGWAYSKWLEEVRGDQNAGK